ncbi:glycosyltransferase [Pseudodesulfovibrio sp.]|uniref:glycosyltransferase family 2 protein n=1 Tax=Pseudodesulfovibrio sp. TaxID=2035812 RepID=UPI00263A0D41|nr:glycosyltransferase [Pseudodesulfovibrio sp.]MDD3311987.1 glycosyltransferase [Pseudodesulfovibrio sp.]
MNDVARIAARILSLVRDSGYLAPDHAVSVAGNILDARPLPDAFTALAAALIRHAAIFDPFNRDKLRLARDVDARVPHPPFSRWLAAARGLTGREPVAENLPLPDIEADGPESFLAYMEGQPANQHRFPALLHLWQSGAGEALIRAVRILAGSPSGLLAGPVLAWGAHAAGDPLLAEMLLDEGVESFPAHNLRARMALDRGDIDGARRHLLASLAAEPFQPAVIEQLAGPAGPVPPPGPDTAVCLYTWNKPDLLAVTLKSLAATDLGEARLVILNNGTTDCAPKELEARVRAAAPSLAPRWVHLPVNVGAPAARNWLLSLEEVRAARYVAFLDDDVLLPRHWLGRYRATLDRLGASAVGPKCVNQRVRTLQYAFRRFSEVGPAKIRFTPNAPNLMDLGQFDGARTCLTVMGCCHLLDRERLNRLGVPGFDIRFSPSQVDDIEHDLQICKAGGRVAYDGAVEVIHLQETGRAKTRAALGQAYANHAKMEQKFSAPELEAMDHAERMADQTAFARALDAVLPLLDGPAATFWRTMARTLA